MPGELRTRELVDGKFIVTFTIDNSHDGWRADNYLKSQYSHFSRAKLQGLIDEGRIVIDGKRLKASTTLRPGDRILAAGAFLPLTTVADGKLAHGTRHRAALGLSEESDALLIVISEENGSIAAASEGTLHENLDRSMLRQLLSERFGAHR